MANVCKQSKSMQYLPFGQQYYSDDANNDAVG